MWAKCSALASSWHEALFAKHLVMLLRFASTSIRCDRKAPAHNTGEDKDIEHASALKMLFEKHFINIRVRVVLTEIIILLNLAMSISMSFCRE
jgi:hypothetical protein